MLHSNHRDIQNWKNYLTRALDMVEIWINIQRNWQRLQPMFASNELTLQLPKEAAELESISALWTNLMIVLLIYFLLRIKLTVLEHKAKSCCDGSAVPESTI